MQCSSSATGLIVAWADCYGEFKSGFNAANQDLMGISRRAAADHDAIDDLSKAALKGPFGLVPTPTSVRTPGMRRAAREPSRASRSHRRASRVERQTAEKIPVALLQLADVVGYLIATALGGEPTAPGILSGAELRKKL